MYVVEDAVHVHYVVHVGTTAAGTATLDKVRHCRRYSLVPS